MHETEMQDFKSPSMISLALKLKRKKAQLAQFSSTAKW